MAEPAQDAASEPEGSDPVQWHSAAPSMALNPGETHLWFTDLDRTAQDETVNFLLTLLDEQERSRALRFRRPQLTERFAAAHGRLRQVLGRYLDMAPQEIRFCYGDRGKPALDPGCLEEPAYAGSGAKPKKDAGLLQFNLSHSDRHGLIAVGYHPLGVDLERLQLFPSAFSLAKRFFSAQEFESLQGLHDLEGDWARSRSFLRHWVCKEAYVKATGEGLMEQLHEVIVRFEPQAAFEHLPASNPHWQVHELRPSLDTLGAVVIPRAIGARFSYWQI